MEADIPTASKDDAAGIEHGYRLFYIRDITTELGLAHKSALFHWTSNKKHMMFIYTFLAANG